MGEVYFWSAAYTLNNILIKMFLSSWMTFQRRRERGRLAARKIEIKLAEAKKKLELEEKTDEEDVEDSSSDEEDSDIEEEDNFYDICKTENEKEDNQSDEKSK